MPYAEKNKIDISRAVFCGSHCFVPRLYGNNSYVVWLDGKDSISSSHIGFEHWSNTIPCAVDTPYGAYLLFRYLSFRHYAGSRIVV